MTLTIDRIRYGEYSGYLAYPTRAGQPLPAVIVIQEAWGVDEHIEDVTRRIALAGYAAFAVDVYARNGERPAALTRERGAELKGFFDALRPDQMADPAKRDAAVEEWPEPGRSRLRESIQAMFATLGNAEENLRPVLAAAKYLREENAVTRGQKVGSVGFCMGGGLSALLACADPALAGAVIFYGMAPSEEKIAALRCPLLGLYGGLDARIGAGIPGFLESMRKHGKSLEHHVYEGAAHAFFNDTRPVYDVRASRDAFVRTLSFFQRNLA